MQKRAPTLGNMIVIILFVLSCFGLLLFLWESFGGPLPLKPKGYRMTVAFPKSLALAEQSGSAHQRREHRARRRAEARRRRAHARGTGNQPEIRADPREHARDPAPEDAARRDLRAADPAGQRTQRALRARRRPARRQPGRTVGHARRRPLRVRSQDAPRLPDLAAVAGRRDQRARRTAQRRLLADRPVRPARQHARRHPRLPGGRRARAGARTRASCSTRSAAAIISWKG